jgi:WhiB family redox-sensing transcriptional regulator
MNKTQPVLLKAAYEWEDEAACKGMPLELFFGSDEFPMTNVQARDGRMICASCPVRRDCLVDALLKREANGMRGGYLGHERRTAVVQHGGSMLAAMEAFDEGWFYVPRRRKR